MRPVIDKPDHVWELPAKHDPVYYANILTQEHDLELSETCEDAIVIRSVAGTTDYYNIVEIMREEHGILGGGRILARFQHEDSPRTDVAERKLEDFKVDTVTDY